MWLTAILMSEDSIHISQSIIILHEPLTDCVESDTPFCSTLIHIWISNPVFYSVNREKVHMATTWLNYSMHAATVWSKHNDMVFVALVPVQLNSMHAWARGPSHGIWALANRTSCPKILLDGKQYILSWYYIGYVSRPEYMATHGTTSWQNVLVRVEVQLVLGNRTTINGINDHQQ